MAAADEYRELVNLISITPFESAEAEWRQALTWLRLPIFYQPALRLAMANSKWRAAKDVGRYLRTVTIRQAERLGLADVDGPVPISGILVRDQSHDDFLDGDPDAYDYDDSIYLQIDEDLVADGFGIDWGLVGDRAGLDEDEIDVLNFRAMGYSRREILQDLAADEQDRLQLQAAWRRIRERRADIKAVLAGEPPRKPKRRVHRD